MDNSVKKNLFLCYFCIEHLALKKVKPFIVRCVNEQLRAPGKRSSGGTQEGTELAGRISALLVWQ